ncbi:hypothetical protein B0H63DRAFT_457204 [Podospora didyma]|uniref:MICOS complex subunit mic19 n=1 Tax=Podospora didyma TaxID=330526 RepID=A0AAE0P4E7_9PEZI|nr:hypothetical protein B0H63DRAFT_457204 [Podospora didyma]
MGSSTSKPSTPLVWKASSDLVDTLEASPETNASRQQNIELEIQARVAAELKRLQASESAALKEAQEKISAAQESNSKQDGLSRQSVSKEVEALRAKLEERRKVRVLPDGVESARNEVVRCLRENDRRPLDCWREVEQFKEEVRRLEKGWVDKVVN